MKTDWTNQLASALIKGGLIYDDKAETREEISTKLGFKKTFTILRIRALLKSGKLEKVRKMVGKNSVVAYRVKQ